MRLVRVVLILAVALLMVCPVLAQEKKKGGRRGPQSGADRVKMLLEGLTLTDEQKTKIADVNKDFDAKVAEARKKSDGILTDDQKKARADAEKAAKEAGKSEREVRAAGREALKITDEQKSKLAAAMKDAFGLDRQRVEKVLEALTPEQQEQVKKKIEEGKKKREGKKKDQ